MSLEKLITISSDDKDSDSVSNSNFWVTLKENYYTQNITRILIKEATVPNCFYNISDGTNNGKQNDILYYIDAKVNKNCRYKYKEHYNIGDIVWVSGDYDATTIMRVTEHAQVLDENGESSIPTLTPW